MISVVFRVFANVFLSTCREEIMEAFPDAKVICTDRDAGKWVESYSE